MTRLPRRQCGRIFPHGAVRDFFHRIAPHAKTQLGSEHGARDEKGRSPPHGQLHHFGFSGIFWYFSRVSESNPGLFWQLPTGDVVETPN